MLKDIKATMFDLAVGGFVLGFTVSTVGKVAYQIGKWQGKRETIEKYGKIYDADFVILEEES